MQVATAMEASSGRLYRSIAVSGAYPGAGHFLAGFPHPWMGRFGIDQDTDVEAVRIVGTDDGDVPVGEGSVDERLVLDASANSAALRPGPDELADDACVPCGMPIGERTQDVRDDPAGIATGRDHIEQVHMIRQRTQLALQQRQPIAGNGRRDRRRIQLPPRRRRAA
ncbi:hypothetical protein OG738_21685 [Amycolatopsis sp. NBC_01488]|uniref:hypothetical protein n=1 Tax=Amycolatopsis sp. NBC_01488 TaxID=2903563 RepID=UPI002E2C8096|nr:hypothetical protein [Amycolatopsis sp. NBC_01488]